MHIQVRYQPYTGIKNRYEKESEGPQPVEMYLKGLMARIFQHEIDHLNGVVNWEEHDHFKILKSQSIKDFEDEKFFE